MSSYAARFSTHRHLTATAIQHEYAHRSDFRPVGKELLIESLNLGDQMTVKAF
jgi:hypothetical protein